MTSTERGASPGGSRPASRRSRVRAHALAWLAMAIGLGGCAWAPPRPWEKGELARPAMQFDPPGERLEMRYQEQVYTSKEAAGGGWGVGGGGCGCN